MQVPFEILVLTSGVGILQSLFFGVYIFTLPQRKRLSNILLACLLIAFALRMAKSVSYYFAPGHEIPQLAGNIGFAAQTTLGPLLLLYLKAVVDKSFSIQNNKKHLSHFFPAGVILLLSPIISKQFWLTGGGYSISLVQMGCYLAVSLFIVAKSFREMDHNTRRWTVSIVTGVTLVWAAYAANYFLGWVTYISAPVVFSVVIYFMSYLGLKQNALFTKEDKYRKSVFTSKDVDGCFEKLQALMPLQPYKDHGITLPKLAKQLGVASNLLSQTINEKVGLSFPDYINSHRVREAQKLLKGLNAERHKISSVAFDAGFNTISAFNAAFKKFSGMPPSEFRKRSVAV